MLPVTVVFATCIHTSTTQNLDTTIVLSHSTLNMSCIQHWFTFPVHVIGGKIFSRPASSINVFFIVICIISSICWSTDHDSCFKVFSRVTNSLVEWSTGVFFPIKRKFLIITIPNNVQTASSLGQFDNRFLNIDMRAVRITIGAVVSATNKVWFSIELNWASVLSTIYQCSVAV